MTTDVQDATEAFEEAKNGWSEVYELAKSDLAFGHGDGQWDAADLASRKQMSRPSLTINLLPQFINQVVNDIRIKQPSINVSPVGDGADIETAKVQQGLIRNIEYTSSASEAYVTALEYAVRGGIGFFRIDHDFERLTGAEQQIFIKKVVNPFAIYIDPNSIESDGCDAMYGFVVDGMTEKQFNTKYHGFDPVSFNGAKTHKRDEKQMLDVAEYFKINEEEKKVAYLEDGSIAEYQKGMDGVRVVRSIKKKTVSRYKMSGQDILEETRFPGYYIPLVPVYGAELWMDGKRHIKSLIHDMKDSQRMHNYWASLETQILMMQPIAPVMAAVGQTEDFADDWNNPGKAMVLRYKTTDAMGNPISAPQRLAPPSIPSGVINARQSSAEDMKASVGMYNESLGQRSNAVSGIAINNRKVEGEIATLHFGDNLNRSIAHGGRIIISMIPEIYDTSRVIRIMGEDEVSEEVGVNGQIVEGQKRAFDVTAGQYDVRVTTGSSFTTKRQEAVQFIQTLIQAVPEIAAVSGDILVKNMDFPGAEALAARLRKMVPPELLSDKEKQSAEQQQDPEKLQMQQVIQEGQALVQQATQKIEQLEEALKNKQQSEQIGLQLDSAKLELEKEKIENDRMKIQIDAQRAQTDQFKAESDAELKAAELHIQAQQPQQPPVREQSEAASVTQGMPPISIVMPSDGLEQHSDAQGQMAAAIVNALNGLTAAVNTPKSVVRDEQGKVVGVQ